MGDIERDLYVKAQGDRIRSCIGCPPVTVHSNFDVFTLSSSNILSNTQKQIISAILVVALGCLWWLIYDILFSDEKQGRSRDDAIFAEELQLLEALKASRSQIKAPKSSSSKTDTSSMSSSSSSQMGVSSSSSIHAKSKPSYDLKMKQPMVTCEASQSSESFCTICMDTKSASEMFSNPTVCGHLYCSNCICQHVSAKIKENIMKVKCPNPKCEGVIGPEHCRSIIPKEVIERWDDALCESLILGTQNFYCPFEDCSAMMVDDGGEAVTSSVCPNCNRLFCAQCKVAWHSGMKCSEFKRLKEGERNPNWLPSHVMQMWDSFWL